MPAQYAVYMRKLVTGDLGQSLRYRTPVIDLLPRRAAVTLFLVVYSLVLSVLIAVPLAMVAATHRERWPDQLVRALITLPLASPAFWIGILLLTPLRAQARVVPGLRVRRGVRGAPPAPVPAGPHPLARLHRRADPQPPLGPDRRADDDVRRLRARQGARPARACCSHHVLRAALLPIVTLIGVRLSYAIGGSVVVETVFALPGLGSWMVESILARDYMVVQTADPGLRPRRDADQPRHRPGLPAVRSARPGGLGRAPWAPLPVELAAAAPARAAPVASRPLAGGAMLGLLVAGRARSDRSCRPTIRTRTTSTGSCRRRASSIPSAPTTSGATS